MKQVVPSWLRVFSREAKHLIVEGQIVDIGTHEPRTHLGPKPAPAQARITLNITHALLNDDSPRSIADIAPPEFSGPIELLNQLSIGDRVRLTTTTLTGRKIQHIDVVPSND